MKKSKVKLVSDIHETMSGIIQTKDKVKTKNAANIKRIELISDFINMRDIEIENDDGEKETIINFGTSNRVAQTNIVQLENLVLGNDSNSEIVLDRNDPNLDPIMGGEITLAANKWLFRDQKMYNFWTSFVGGSYVSGGGSVVWHKKDKELYPEFTHRLLFPDNTPLLAEEFTYAFEKREFTLQDLKRLRDESKKTKDRYVDSEAIEQFIENIEGNINSNSRRSSSSEMQIFGSKSNRGDDCHEDNDTLIEGWTYYELRYQEDGPPYVSQLTFVQELRTSETVTKNVDEDYGGAVILDQTEKFFDDVDDWLIFGVLDTEINEHKTVANLRGPSELYYKPGVKLEELNNRQMEGAIVSSTPKLQRTGEVNIDEIESFEEQDVLLPNNTQFAQIPNTASSLSPIVADLKSNVSGISATSVSNAGQSRGGELRQQALERQGNSQVIKDNKINKAVFLEEEVMNRILYRALTFKCKGRDADYKRIKGFQAEIDRKIIETYNLVDDVDETGLEDTLTAAQKARKIREEIGTREYGKFVYLTVRPNRVVTGLDRAQEIDTGRMMLEFLAQGGIPEQNAPAFRQQAIVYMTGNPDIAKLASPPPEQIQAEQNERASAEWAAILNRATIGEIYPVGVRDIHLDHVQTHTKDLMALINRHQLEPWTQLTVAQFTAAVNHIGLHIQQLTSRRETAQSAKQLMKQLQEMTNGARQIVQQVEDESQQQEVSVDDQLKMAKVQQIQHNMEISARKLGIEIEDKQSTIQQRNRRDEQSERQLSNQERQSLVNEVVKQQELNLKQQQQNGKENRSQ